jgi:predicted nucleic acid-binding protein
MSDKVFIDTNILLYALTEPKEKDKAKDLPKRTKSLELLTKLYNENDIVISVQILNELHFNMVRKFKIDDKLTFKTLQENVFAIVSIENLTVQTYTKAFQIRERYNISYWDSLVVASALESGCKKLYSEDMQEGLVVNGVLNIINPFL